VRYLLAIIKPRLFAAVFALTAAAPAVAGQPTGGIDLSGPLPGGPPPADSGKPTIGGPPTSALGPEDAAGCPTALPCGARLLGTVRKNGAVELQVPALRW
jgi:hypothetical protein